MPPIIRVENLGKKYTLRHQGEGGGRYRRFSEELLDALKRPFRSLRRAPRSPLPAACSGLPAPRSLLPAPSEEFWALRNVSFEVQQGEVLGIIGRNGAGKSTLLKVLSRITEPSEGRVTLNGRVASLLEVGTGFHPELTGRENVFLNGAILGMSRVEIRRKFDAIVAFAEVEKFLDTPVKRYSSGMYVRLAFAVAAHLEPEILIVDEVLAVGDAAFQKKCLGKMGEVASAGRTVLFVSHNLIAVEHLCVRALLLQAGTLVADGSTASVLARYSAELETVTGIPVALRADREGSGEVRAIAVDVLSPAGGRIAFRCGDPIKFAVACRGMGTALHDLAIHLGIYLPNGLKLLHLSSSGHQQIDCRKDGRWEASCVLVKNYLAPGQYHVNVAILDGNRLVDRVESAAFFEVQAADFHGNGQLFGHDWGAIFLADQIWSVSESADTAP